MSCGCQRNQPHPTYMGLKSSVANLEPNHHHPEGQIRALMKPSQNDAHGEFGLLTLNGGGGNVLLVAAVILCCKELVRS